MNGMINYPEEYIDPREKDDKWCAKYIKAAHQAWLSEAGTWRSMMDRHQERKLYAHGRQSIDIYKKTILAGKTTDKSYASIDWSVVPVIPKYRSRALSMLRKKDFDILGQVIDPDTQKEIESYFNRLRAKIELREELERMDPGASKGTPLDIKEGEPEDLDEYKIYKDFRYKHWAASEMEKAIKWGFESNRFDELRNQIDQDLFDDGIAACREYTENGRIKIERVHPQNLVVSYCEKRDFSDKKHAGHYRRLTLGQLKDAWPEMPSDVAKEIERKIKSGFQDNIFKSSNTAHRRYDYDDPTIQVLHLTWFSVDTKVYEKRVNRKGNQVFGPTDYYKRSSRNEYVEESVQCVYEGNWIVGTDYVFGCGLMDDQKRRKSNLAETELPYHIFAYDLHDMQPRNFMDQLIPLADQFQLAWLKRQQILASAKPKGIKIDANAIEALDSGGGGALSEIDALDLYNETGNYLYRSIDVHGEPINFNPISELENGMSKDFIYLTNVLTDCDERMRQLVGLNDITDGSTPDPKTLNGVAQMAAAASNNALDSIFYAEKWIAESLANALVLRYQSLVKNWPVEGMTRALGKNTVNFFKLSKDVAAIEIGIILRDRPDDVERAELKQRVMIMAERGELGIEDVGVIEFTDNLREAWAMLTHLAKKRKKEQLQESMMLQQQNAQVQQQSAIVAAEQERETEMLKHQNKLQQQALVNEGMIRVAEIHAGGNIGRENVRVEGEMAKATVNAAVTREKATPATLQSEGA